MLRSVLYQTMVEIAIARLISTTASTFDYYHIFARSLVFCETSSSVLALILQLSRQLDAYMPHWAKPTLVEMMACCLSDAKPLSEVLLTCCHLEPDEQISVAFELKYNFLTKLLPAWWALWLPWWPPAGCNNALMYLLILTMNFCYCFIVVFCWK